MSEKEKETEILKGFVRDSENIVFFGGAGVSTESGIPDFRSADGLYNQTYRHPPEVMLSYPFFVNNAKEFYDFYKNKIVNTEAKPNKAHIALAELEAMGKLKAVITQNIDGLHQAAGSKNVLELHGSIYRNYCMRCEKSYGIDAVAGSGTDVPVCACGGVIRPDVVLYKENLDTDVIAMAAGYLANADMLIIGGTSLSVYPAAGLTRYYTGKRLVLINKSVTPFDGKANLLIRGSIGDILSKTIN
jgi:NAD-dependent deacetylase